MYDAFGNVYLANDHTTYYIHETITTLAQAWSKIFTNDRFVRTCCSEDVESSHQICLRILRRSLFGAELSVT